jgi:hypothetical protein
MRGPWCWSNAESVCLCVRVPLRSTHPRACGPHPRACGPSSRACLSACARVRVHADACELSACACWLPARRGPAASCVAVRCSTRVATRYAGLHPCAAGAHAIPGACAAAIPGAAQRRTQRGRRRSLVSRRALLSELCSGWASGRAGPGRPGPGQGGACSPYRGRMLYQDRSTGAVIRVCRHVHARAP